MTFFDADAAVSRLLDRRWLPSPSLASAPARVWTRRETSLAIAMIVMFTILAFVRWRVVGAVVPWDSKNHFYPMFRFLGESLRNGTVPLWNPYHFGGYPAVADPQSLVFTPSMALFALAVPHASMQLFDAVIFAHLATGAIGMVLLARRWGWHPLAGILAALIYGFGASAASRLQHTGMIISYSWFPPALYLMLRALDTRSIARAVGAGLLAVLMAMGRDQVAFLLCLTLAGGVICEVAAHRACLAYARERWGVIACAAAVTLACTLVPILLTMQFLHGSNRPGIPFGVALEGSLDPANILTMLAPNVFGSLDNHYDYWGPGAATVAGNDWTDRSIDYLFLGTAPIVLLLWGGVAEGRLAWRAARPFAILLGAALIYALGRHTPLFPLLFDWMPGVALYRRPADATFILTIAMALLSGFLLHAFLTVGETRGRTRGPLRLLRHALAVAVVALVVGTGLGFAAATHHLSASLERMAIPSTFACIVLGLVVAARSPSARVKVGIGLVALTAAQLLVYNCASPLNTEPTSAYSANGTLPAEDRHLLSVLRAQIAADHAAGERPRLEIIGQNQSWQNASMMFRLEDTAGYNPLRIADYERTVGVAESANDPALRAFPPTFRGFNSRMAALLGLRYLMLDRPVDRLPRGFPRPDGSLIFAGPHMALYRLATPIAPRASLATQVTVVDDDPGSRAAALQSLSNQSAALLDIRDAGKLHLPAQSSSRAGDPVPGAVRIVAHEDNRVGVMVDAARPGLLVLHDPFYPGWQATVDGKDAPVLRADLIFRGVEVPAGHHQVEFSFHPFALKNLASAIVQLVGGRGRS